MLQRADVWICKRKGKGNRIHYGLRWFDPETLRKRYQSTGTDRKLAERMAQLKREQLRRGILRDPEAVPWAQFAADELTHVGALHSPAYRVIVQTALETFAAECSPASPLHVTGAMVERYVASRMKGSRRCKARNCGFANPIDRTTCHKCSAELSGPIRPVTAHTVCKNARALHVAFEHARKRYNLPANPFSEAELPRVIVTVKRTLTLDEQRRALDACPNVVWRAFLHIGLTTGVRRGDLAALKWDGVNLEAGRMTINERKTGRRRTVHLTPTAAALLREVRLTHAFPEVFIHYGKAGQRVGFYEAVGPMMDRIAESAAIPRFGFHSTRRTLATDLAAAGVNQVVCTAVIGHASMATTAQFYTAVSDGTKRAALEKLPLERTGS